MTQNSSEMLIGAVGINGAHVFRSQINVDYSSNYYFYQKIVSFQDKVLFINTGGY